MIKRYMCDAVFGGGAKCTDPAVHFQIEEHSDAKPTVGKWCEIHAIIYGNESSLTEITVDEYEVAKVLYA